jgi:hypothetical protein
MAQRAANYPIVRDSQGEQTNPTTATVMADTGELDAEEGGGGIYEALVVLSASATAKFQVEVRNAANGATVGDAHIVYAAANTPVAIPFRFEIERDQRIRVMMNANLTGTAAVNLVAQRVA